MRIAHRTLKDTPEDRNAQIAYSAACGAKVRWRCAKSAVPPKVVAPAIKPPAIAPVVIAAPVKAEKPGRKAGKEKAEKIEIKLPASTPEDRQSQLKLLIARGKEQSFLTYAEVNDHLPSEIVDPGQDRRHRADDQRHGHPGVREGTGRRSAADARGFSR